jgi:hypothetical protein
MHLNPSTDNKVGHLFRGISITATPATLTITVYNRVLLSVDSPRKYLVLISVAGGAMVVLIVIAAAIAVNRRRSKPKRSSRNHLVC